jgi:hypothetical protein
VLAEPEVPFWGFGEVFLSFAMFLTALWAVVTIARHFLGANVTVGYWAVLEELAAYLLLFAALKVMFFWQQKPLLRSLGWVPQPFSPWALASAGLMLVFVSLMLQFVLGTPEIETPFDKLLNGDPLSRVAIAVFGVTVGPVIEELLFRGFLQPVFVSAAGVFPGILITSMLFGAVHLAQNANLWQSGVLITIAGFGFGVVRHVSGSTRASAITHIAYNSLPFLVTLLQGAPPDHK